MLRLIFLFFNWRLLYKKKWKSLELDLRESAVKGEDCQVLKIISYCSSNFQNGVTVLPMKKDFLVKTRGFYNIFSPFVELPFRSIG